MTHCRLFLVTPVSATIDHISACLKSAQNAGNIASLLIRWQPDIAAFKEIAQPLVQIAQDMDIAALIENDIELAAELKADGLHLPGDAQALTAGREVLGPDIAIGVNCGANRHAAMELGEKGASYIAFSNLDDPRQKEPVLTWWSDTFELPCVAYDEVELANAPSIITQGADFIRPSDAMWESPNIAATTVRALNDIIEKVPQS